MRRRYQCFNEHRFTTLEEFVEGSLTDGPLPTGRTTNTIEPFVDRASRFRRRGNAAMAS
jgi:hypothetical protein